MLFLSCFYFRAHQNDLENIPVLLIITLLYMFANLSPVRRIWRLRIFTAARIVHSVGYLNGISGLRGIGFMAGSICIAVLGVSVLLSAVHTGVY